MAIPNALQPDAEQDTYIQDILKPDDSSDPEVASQYQNYQAFLLADLGEGTEPTLHQKFLQQRLVYLSRLVDKSDSHEEFFDEEALVDAEELPESSGLPILPLPHTVELARPVPSGSQPDTPAYVSKGHPLTADDLARNLAVATQQQAENKVEKRTTLETTTILEFDKDRGRHDEGQFALGESQFETGFLSIMGRRFTQEDTAFATVLTVQGKKVEYHAVFDGHGGDATAQALADTATGLHLHVQKELESVNLDDTSAVANALQTAITKMDDTLKEHEDDGATAIITVTIAHKLYTLNIGDARAVLVKKDGSFQRLSYDHKPNNPEETARIETARGFVDSKTGRVLGMLAVARSFGDYAYEGKDHQKLISHEAFITCTDIDEDDTVVLACDGLWDTVRDEEVSSILALAGKEASHKKAAALVTETIRRGSTDNVSVMVSRLKPIVLARTDVDSQRRELPSSDPLRKTTSEPSGPVMETGEVAEFRRAFLEVTNTTAMLTFVAQAKEKGSEFQKQILSVVIEYLSNSEPNNVRRATDFLSIYENVGVPPVANLAVRFLEIFNELPIARREAIRKQIAQYTVPVINPAMIFGILNNILRIDGKTPPIVFRSDSPEIYSVVDFIMLPQKNTVANGTCFWASAFGKLRDGYYQDTDSQKQRFIDSLSEQKTIGAVLVNSPEQDTFMTEIMEQRRNLLADWGSQTSRYPTFLDFLRAELLQRITATDKEDIGFIPLFIELYADFERIDLEKRQAYDSMTETRTQMVEEFAKLLRSPATDPVTQAIKAKFTELNKSRSLNLLASENIRKIFTDNFGVFEEMILVPGTTDVFNDTQIRRLFLQYQASRLKELQAGKELIFNQPKFLEAYSRCVSHTLHYVGNSEIPLIERIMNCRIHIYTNTDREATQFTEVERADMLPQTTGRQDHYVYIRDGIGTHFSHFDYEQWRAMYQELYGGVTR